MGSDSKIQWTTHTFNPWRGCTKVSAGCANCYAETLSRRNPTTLGIWGPNGTRVVASEAMWREPLKWNKEAATFWWGWERAISKHGGKSEAIAAGVCKPARPRVFCASLADVFEDWQGPMVGSKGESLWMPWSSSSWWKPSSSRPCPRSSPLKMQDVRTRLYSVIDQTPHLDWLLLTKRPHNLFEMLPWQKTPWGNIWLGTSVEDQKAADERIPHLLKVPAKVRFLSVEPLLGPITLTLTGIHWVIIGGESGPGARPCNVEWIRDIVDQCTAAGVSVFVKQLGSRPQLLFDGSPWSLIDWPRGTRYDAGADGISLRLTDPKGGNWDEWPEELRIREFPTTQSN